MDSVDLLKRAFELARSGNLDSVTSIKRALTGEGYGNVRQHLDGAGIQKQLADIVAGRAERQPHTKRAPHVLRDLTGVPRERKPRAKRKPQAVAG